MGIEHVVVLCLENHSFDEYFGTFPGARGFFDDSPAFAQPWGPGTLYPWRMSTFTSLNSVTPGCGHDWNTMHAAVGPEQSDWAYPLDLTKLQNLGFYTSQAGSHPGVMGYYAANDIPYHWALARDFALCDNYFASALAGTASNRMFLAGGTILPTNDPSAAGLTGDVYTYNPSSASPDDQPVAYNAAPPGYQDGVLSGRTTPLSQGNSPGLPPFHAHWQSYLAQLANVAPPDSSTPVYRVYDDWNWLDSWATPTSANPQTSLNAFAYYQLYEYTPSSGPDAGTPVTMQLGCLGDPTSFAGDPSSAGGNPDPAVTDDPNYFGANYNASGAAGDDRPLFCQHVNPMDGSPGVLAQVTWIMPPWNYCEHPSSPSLTQSADGAHYISQIFDALYGSEFWGTTVLVITWDETDCHFDHVVPPLPPEPTGDEPWVDTQGGINDAGLGWVVPVGAGMRVPMIVVSPWTYRQGVIHAPMDHTSILRLMATVTGPPLQDGTLSSWRTQVFPDDLGTVIASLGSSPATAIDRSPATGVPPSAVVDQWRLNAQARRSDLPPGVPALVDPSGTGQPSAMQPWPPAVQSCQVLPFFASYGADQVTAKAAGGSTASFTNGIFVIVDGFEPWELTTPNASGAPGTPAGQSGPPTRYPAISVTDSDGNQVGISTTFASVSPDPTTVQQVASGLATRFTFSYDVIFDMQDASTFAFNGAVENLTINAAFTSDVTVSNSAPLELVKVSDPQFYGNFQDDTTWLSNEIKVFQIDGNGQQFGIPVGDDPHMFLSNLLTALQESANSGSSDADNWFDSLSGDEESSWLSLLPTNAQGNVYNFAIARVHLQSLDTAPEVGVFFRLFPAAQTATSYDPDGAYLAGPSTVVPYPIALPGVKPGSSGQEWATLPFFAQGRVAYTDALDAQTDPLNRADIPPPGVLPQPGTVYEQFYGCYLDINQNNDPYVPASGVPSGWDGSQGFPAADQPWSPFQWIQGLHQCVVAEISFAPISIPPGSSPGDSSWLAQRNIVFVPSTG
jgi:phospholipase C